VAPVFITVTFAPNVTLFCLERDSHVVVAQVELILEWVHHVSATIIR
jgi:hypothetical protein